MTTPDAKYPDDDTSTENAVTAHDLDPTNGDGDLVRHVSLARTQALLVAVHSVDSNGVSVSVRWIDDETSDNQFVQESKTDTELDTVTDDWARLVRKGPVAEVTVTSEVADGTQNRVNAYLDAHR